MSPFHRLILVTAAVLLLAGYGYFTLRGPQGLAALDEKRQVIRQLEEQNANLQRENEYKKERIKKLGESPSEQDLLIRDKLKKVHKNDTEFMLPGGAPAADNTAKPEAEPQN